MPSRGAGEDLEPGLGHKGVDEAGDEVEVFFAEFGGGDAVVTEGGFVGGASGTPWGVIEEQVVDGDVEDFGEPDEVPGRPRLEDRRLPARWVGCVHKVTQFEEGFYGRIQGRGPGVPGRSG